MVVEAFVSRITQLIWLILAIKSKVFLLIFLGRISSNVAQILVYLNCVSSKIVLITWEQEQSGLQINAVVVDGDISWCIDGDPPEWLKEFKPTRWWCCWRERIRWKSPATSPQPTIPPPSATFLLSRGTACSAGGNRV